MTLFKNTEIDLKKASLLSGYHTDYLSSLIRSGKIKGRKVGRSWVTTENALKEYINIAEAKPVPIHSTKAFLIGFALLFMAIGLGFWVSQMISASSENLSAATSTADSLSPENQAGFLLSSQSPHYKLYEPASQ
jgi:hypothetical protein